MSSSSIVRTTAAVAVVIAMAGLFAMATSPTPAAAGSEHVGHASPAPAKHAEAPATVSAAAKQSGHHDAFAYFAGDWKAESRMYMAGPDADPVVSQGEAKGQVTFNGRFVEWDYSGTISMPSEDGTMTPIPFQGRQVIGFDRNRNTYVSTWLDNFGTGIHVMRGSRVSTSPLTIHFYGEMDDTMQGVVGRMVRHEIRVIDANRFVTSMVDFYGSGSGNRMMEIEYTRVADTEDAAD